MKKKDLERTIRLRATAEGKRWELLRSSGPHEVWRCGETKVSIPGHREINELTAAGILKVLEAEFGERWWR